MFVLCPRALSSHIFCFVKICTPRFLFSSYWRRLKRTTRDRERERVRACSFVSILRTKYITITLWNWNRNFKKIVESQTTIRSHQNRRTHWHWAVIKKGVYVCIVCVKWLMITQRRRRQRNKDKLCCVLSWCSPCSLASLRRLNLVEVGASCVCVCVWYRWLFSSSRYDVCIREWLS